MDHNRRKELSESYKQIIPAMGIMQVKNLRNGKVYLVSSANLDKAPNRETFMLKMGSHTNRELQKDWSEYGEEAFSIEIVDQLKLSEEDRIGPETTKKYKDDLKLLEELWMEKLAPYGDKGYHKEPVKRG